MLYEVSKLYVSPLDVNSQRIDTYSIFLGLFLAGVVFHRCINYR